MFIDMKRNVLNMNEIKLKVGSECGFKVPPHWAETLSETLLKT